MAYQLYGTVYERFTSAAKIAGIPEGFTPHSLRHAFASAMLGKGVPITDIAPHPYVQTRESGTLEL